LNALKNVASEYLPLFLELSNIVASALSKDPKIRLNIIESAIDVFEKNFIAQ